MKRENEILRRNSAPEIAFGNFLEYASTHAQDYLADDICAECFISHILCDGLRFIADTHQEVTMKWKLGKHYRRTGKHVLRKFLENLERLHEEKRDHDECDVAATLKRQKR